MFKQRTAYLNLMGLTTNDDDIEAELEARSFRQNSSNLSNINFLTVPTYNMTCLMNSPKGKNFKLKQAKTETSFWLLQVSFDSKPELLLWRRKNENIGQNLVFFEA